MLEDHQKEYLEIGPVFARLAGSLAACLQAGIWNMFGLMVLCSLRFADVVANLERGIFVCK